jgi:PAS domain S-box-containing protein
MYATAQTRIGAWDGIGCMAADSTPGLLKTRALRKAILISAGFASIATDKAGVIQIFSPGAARMLGYTDVEVVNKLTPADFCDPLELASKASRGIEDKDRLTFVHKDGSRLSVIVSVTALHDAKGEVLGSLLIAIESPGRKQIEAAPAPRAGTPPRRKLLYIEDQPASVGPVEQLVARRPDLMLLHAGDVKLGFELARTARPELILLNIDVAGPSAAALGPIHFMKLVRADAATQHTPIVALSVNAAPNAMAKALEAGFFHYLIKPVQAEPFMQALGDALEFAARERAEENDMPARHLAAVKAM